MLCMSKVSPGLGTTTVQSHSLGARTRLKVCFAWMHYDDKPVQSQLKTSAEAPLGFLQLKAWPMWLLRPDRRSQAS